MYIIWQAVRSPHYWEEDSGSQVRAGCVQGSRPRRKQGPIYVYDAANGLDLQEHLIA